MVCIGATAFAETHLSDKIGGRVFEPAGNPYIVDQDIVIPQNDRSVVKAGCVFLFKSFTGINVYGSLIVEGTTENPVVFTSINDASYYPEASQLPNAFDWNGIYVAENSGDVKLRNFKLMYSVYGIKSKKDEITLQNGSFKQNGQFHFTINDNIHYVQDNLSYSYNVPESSGKTQEEPRKNVDETNTGKEPRHQRAAMNRGRKIAAFSTAGVCLVSGVTCIVASVKAVQLKDEAERQITPEAWNRVNDRFQVAKGVAIGTGITAGISLPVDLFLFVKKEKSTMTQKVSLDVRAAHDAFGIGFTRRF
jgi:hypothetical protein